LIPERPKLRLLGVALVLFAAVSVVFQFTRATYLGLALAIIIVGAYWLYGNTSIGQRLRRGVAVCAALVILGIFVSDWKPLTTSFVPAPAAAAVSERASSSFDELIERTGTVRYRYELQDEMRRVLGDNWPMGLGFWHPEFRPVASLPQGSIRNGDVGVFNAIMTMGVIGTVLLYVPLLALFVVMMRTRGTSEARIRRQHWFFFGASTWLLYVVLSSASLVTLFGPPGLMLVATILASAIWLIDANHSREQ
jgi:hypothetical protein